MDRTSTEAKTLYPKGPSFTLENFSNKDFIVRDFVDSLAESAVPINRRSGQTQQAFDAKPLIRTFENALEQLETLKKELQEKESEILSQVRSAEIEHDETLETLGRKLDESMSSFEALDVSVASRDKTANSYDRQNKPDGEGNVAVQIGEKLEDLDRKRRRAQDAQFLIQCWSQVSDTGRLTFLEDIRRHGGAENKIRCAVIARQLMRISQQLDPTSWGQANGNRMSSAGANGNGNDSGNGPKSHNTREIIEKFCESLEQDLLQQFDSSYDRQSYDDMMECARVLHDFNGGASVIASFVSRHQFFIDRDQLTNDEVVADTEFWEPIADPDATPPGVEASLQSLIDEVKIVMQEESFVIRRAFPYYETVLTKFTQRVFQQSIQQRLEKVLDKADTVSSLAFLRSLHSSRSYISSLIEDLKTHGLTEHPEPCSGQIAQVLDQQVDELFVPYLVGNLYIEREKKSLEEMYSSLLFKFNMYHSRKKKAPTGFMASLAQQGTQLMASAKDAYLERLESSDLTPTQKATMLRVAGLKEKDNKDEIELSEEDGQLNVASAKRMLKWLAESVQRTLELGSAAETPKEMSVFLGLLLGTMGEAYVETALDAAHMQATLLEHAKTEPDMSYLPAIRPAVTIAAMMDRFIGAVLIRLAEPNTTVRKSMEAQKKMAMDGIERRTNAVLKVSVDVVVNYVGKTLGGQKKQDFRPKDAELESLQTPTCLAICTFLGRVARHASAAVGSSSGSSSSSGVGGDDSAAGGGGGGGGANATKLLSELAAELHRLLFDHFQRFQVNATGGLMVTQDIAKYVSVVRDWPLARDVAAAMELLTEIGSLFIVGPEALREKSRGLVPGVGATGGSTGGGSNTAAAAGAAGKLSKADFKAFVQKRDDAGSVAIQNILAGL